MRFTPKSSQNTSNSKFISIPEIVETSPDSP